MKIGLARAARSQASTNLARAGGGRAGDSAAGSQVAQRGTAGPGGSASWPAAEVGRGRRLRTVLLVNGARVVAGPGTVDRGPTVMLPGGGRAGSLIGLSLAGRSHLLPPEAAPYLGRGAHGASSGHDYLCVAKKDYDAPPGWAPPTVSARSSPASPGVRCGAPGAPARHS
jgi:hypothetical protein